MASSPVSPLVEGEAHGQQGRSQISYKAFLSENEMVLSQTNIPRGGRSDRELLGYLWGTGKVQNYKNPQEGGRYLREGEKLKLGFFYVGPEIRDILHSYHNGELLRTNQLRPGFGLIQLDTTLDAGENEYAFGFRDPYNQNLVEIFGRFSVNALPSSGTIQGSGGRVFSNSQDSSQSGRYTITGQGSRVTSRTTPRQYSTPAGSQQPGLPIRSSQSQSQSVPQGRNTQSGNKLSDLKIVTRNKHGHLIFKSNAK